MKKTLISLALLSAALHAQVPIKGSTVDATQGYTVNGAAPSGQSLCGNGVEFVPMATCGASTGLTSFQGRTTQAAVLTVGDVNGVGTISNSTTGNAATATNATTANALAGTPSQCGGTTPVSVGISAAGNAGCIVAPASPVVQVTASRTFGVTYQNTTGRPLFVTGFGSISGGSGDSTITCFDGPNSGLGVTMWSNTTSSTTSGSPIAFTCGNPIPADYFYTVRVTNIISSTPGSWIETD